MPWVVHQDRKLDVATSRIIMMRIEDISVICVRSCLLMDQMLQSDGAIFHIYGYLLSIEATGTGYQDESIVE